MAWIMRQLLLLTDVLARLSKKEATNSDKIYALSVAKLGQDTSPADRVSDELGCAESLTELLHTLWPEIPIMTGTWTVWEFLKKSSLFKETQYPEPGCIIISPSGTSTKGAKNGHTGIVSKDGVIMSNDSATGVWLENWTIRSWGLYYKDKLGFPVYYYKKT